MIEIIPAVDLIGGRCVRLTRGDYASVKTYDASPVDQALQFEQAGVRRLHLVDLDGAREGRPVNLKILSEIRKATGLVLEWGGGIQKEDHVDMAFECGATHVIVGSTAAREPLKFVKWLRNFGGDRLILGADLRDGKIAVNGWTGTVGLGIDALLEKFVPKGLQEAIVTDISRDGTLEGPSEGLYTDLQERYPTVTFTVSGGISSMEDIRRLDGAGLARVIVGKAFYENRITLEDIRTWLQKG